MNTVVDLLASLKKRGVKIWIEHGQLRCRSPKGALLPKDIEDLHVRRFEIVKVLDGLLSIQTVSIYPRNGIAQAPLTAMQRMPWYYAERPHPRTLAVALRISGALHIDPLQRSVDFLVRRQEALRTRIITVDDPPSQNIDVARGDYLSVVDMTGASRRAEQLMQPLIQEFLDQIIDPAVGPLFDCRIYKLADKEHVLAISIDHIISDGMSIQILCEELWLLYERAVKRQPMHLSPLPLQFADYAVWLAKIHPVWQEIHAPYWKKRLAAAPCVQWPVDQNRIEKSAPEFLFVRVPIDRQLTARLVSFVRHERATPAFAILTTFIVVLSQWCNQTDLTVVIVDSGRHSAGLQRTIGLFATHLHLRLELGNNKTFRDLLDLVKREFCSASDHRDFDWAPSLVPDLRVDILFDWLSATEDWLGESTEKGPLFKELSEQIRIERFPVERIDATPQFGPQFEPPFKIALNCYHTGDELIINLVYRSDLFTVQSMELIARALRGYLEAVIQDPLLSFVPTDTRCVSR